MPASPELSFSKGWESVKKHIKRWCRVTGLRPVNFDRKAALACRRRVLVIAWFKAPSAAAQNITTFTRKSHCQIDIV